MERQIDAQWHKEASYAHFLCSIPGNGIRTMEKMYNLYGILGGYEGVYFSIKEALQNESRVLSEKIGINSRQKASLESWMLEKDVKKEYEKLLYNKIWCIPKYLKGYPDKLKYIYNPPNALYVKGYLPGNSRSVVGVIGARNCSPYGEMMAKEMGRALAKAGIQVISGMARGVDGISQRSALMAGGAVFGVLGCGVDICYPEENLDIYQKMISQKRSGIISEYIPGTEPAPGLFPVRNRIISGLADTIVVVESREKSGTYITVMNALEQGKDVYVIPGRIGDPLSFGCNRLIAQGANVIYDIKQFVSDILGSAGGEQDNEIAKESVGCQGKDRGVLLSDEEKCVYAGLDIQYCPAEEILARTVPQLAFSQGLVILSTLECKGLADSQGGFYRIRT